MTDVFSHPRHVKLWEAATAGQHVDWNEVFHSYHSTVDWPGAAFYEQVMERYPDAKVILTVRDPEHWYQSAHRTIYAISRVTSTSPLFVLAGVFAPHRRRMGRVINTLIWQRLFGGTFDDRKHAIAIFEAHNAAVRRHVPGHRLLVYEVKQGWGPLCGFLGVEVPEGKPFPHLNDTATFQRMIWGIVAVSYGVPIGLAALIVVAVVGLRRRSQLGGVSPNRRKFCHPRSRLATMASRSINFPSLWKV